MAPNFSPFPLITQAGPGKFLMPSFLTAPRNPLLPQSLMEILNHRATVSELRRLTFTPCCFIAYYCARLSSGSRFGQLQSSQGTRRGGATRAWWGYWWGTYRKPHIIHTHQPQHVTPNEASAAFKRLIAPCLPLPSDPLLILRSELGSNSSCLARAGLGSSQLPQSRQALSRELWETEAGGAKRDVRGKAAKCPVPLLSKRNPFPRRGPWLISSTSTQWWPNGGGGGPQNKEPFTDPLKIVTGWDLSRRQKS